MTRLYVGLRLLARALGGAVAGAVVGVSALALHELWWGLLLAVAASLAALVALPRGTWRVAYAAAWLVVVALASVPRPSGSYVIAGNVCGYLMLALALVQLMAAVGTLPRRRVAG